MKKWLIGFCAAIVLVIFISPTRTKAAEEKINPGQVWTEFVAALLRAEPADVTTLTTKRGLASLKRSGESFKNLATHFQRQEIKWTAVRADHLKGILGPDIKGSPIQMVFAEGLWKLDYWGGFGR